MSKEKLIKEKLTYSNAFEELEKILKEMQSDNVPIDNITSKVKRSKELLEFCKEHLRLSQQEIEDIRG